MVKMTNDMFIVVSDVIEYLFCPRFIYFMHCLNIPQHEEKRYKVLKGRDIHDVREKTNKNYLRKKLHCTRKEISVYLASEKYHIKGIVDDVLFLDDGTASLIDYKFAEYRERLFKTYRYQLVLYALMIKENYSVKVNRGFICYTRSNNLVKEVKIRDKDFKDAILIINKILDIIQKGVFPEKTKTKSKCIDCCYRNICV